MTASKFLQVDAFSAKPLYGNPAAVVLDADGISTETMQQITKEMNLSETVFICKPTDPAADYKARIFTPARELPFAGHPTLAAAHTMFSQLVTLKDSSKKVIYQECGVGIIPVKISDAAEIKATWSDSAPINRSQPTLVMTQRSPKYEEPTDEKEELAKILGITVSDFADTPLALIDVGIRWPVAEIASIEALKNIKPNHGALEEFLKKYHHGGITLFCDKSRADPSFSGAVRVRVRTFAPGEGILEDPVCGSGNGAVCGFIAKYRNSNKAPGAFVAEQGVEIGRTGYVFSKWSYAEDGTTKIEIGGQAAVAATGELYY